MVWCHPVIYFGMFEFYMILRSLVLIFTFLSFVIEILKLALYYSCRSSSSCSEKQPAIVRILLLSCLSVIVQKSVWPGRVKNVLVEMPAGLNFEVLHECSFIHIDFHSHIVCHGDIQAVQCNPVQCNEVQCSAIQCSAVQCNAVRCSAMPCETLRCSAVQ